MSTPMPAWTPPDAMKFDVSASWRAFYLQAWKKYGISPTQYRDLYVAQHGCCYICRIAKGMNPDDPKGRGSRRLGVDHNHMRGNGDAGAVRGLLCTGSLSADTCNRLIERYNVHQLKRAIQYMEDEPGQSVIRWGRFADDAMPREKRDQLTREILGLK